MAWRISLLLVLFCLTAIGCDSKPADGGNAKPVSLGIKSNCNVCGDHELDVMSDTPFADFEGQRYYFCSESCKKDFLKNPKAYPGKKPATQPAVR